MDNFQKLIEGKFEIGIDPFGEFNAGRDYSRDYLLIDYGRRKVEIIHLTDEQDANRLPGELGQREADGLAMHYDLPGYVSGTELIRFVDNEAAAGLLDQIVAGVHFKGDGTGVWSDEARELEASFAATLWAAFGNSWQNPRPALKARRARR